MAHLHHCKLIFIDLTVSLWDDSYAHMRKTIHQLKLYFIWILILTVMQASISVYANSYFIDFIKIFFLVTSLGSVKVEKQKKIYLNTDSDWIHFRASTQWKATASAIALFWRRFVYLCHAFDNSVWLSWQGILFCLLQFVNNHDLLGNLPVQKSNDRMQRERTNRIHSVSLLERKKNIFFANISKSTCIQLQQWNRKPETNAHIVAIQNIYFELCLYQLFERK